MIEDKEQKEIIEMLSNGDCEVLSRWDNDGVIKYEVYLKTDWAKVMESRNGDCLSHLGINKETLDYFLNSTPERIEAIKKMARLDSLKKEVTKLEEEIGNKQT